MSLLAVDIDNSHTDLGLLNDGEVAATWRVSTDVGRTSDEWLVVLRGLLDSQWDDIDGVAVCSAVPAALHQWRKLGETGPLANCAHVIVEPGVRTGIPVQVDNPRETGTDRIANALAAATIYGSPAVVVDFSGVTTTFEVINAAGQYVGGAIAPGIEASVDAMRHGGAQLRTVEIARPRSTIAKNTVEALQSGVVFGTASQVDGMVARMVTELDVPPGDVNVIATGYLAPLVLEECRCFTAHSPWLTLRGLELIYARNT